MNRKRLYVGVSATAALAVALAGCGGSSSGNTKNATGAATTLKQQSTPVSKVCQGTPVKGGTLVYARQTGPLTLNPFKPTNGNGDIFADTLIYQGLVRPDPKGSQTLVGGVASSWTESKNGKTYTFHIRPGIKFSNGTPVTAADVQFSLNYWANPNDDSASSLSTGYKKTVIVNNSTVDVELTQATPGLLYNMSIFNAMIVPKKLVQSEGSNFWNNPVGTGPFRVASWTKGSQITFKDNPYYWQPGIPYLNEVKYIYAENDNTRLLDLESGQAQIADGIPFNNIESLSQKKGIDVQYAKVPYWVGLWENHKYAPFNDIHVRQAMSYAIDYAAINQQVFHGAGTIPNSILPQLKLDAPNSVVKPYSYDLDKAKQLMAESKYPHGFTATLQYFSGYTEYTDLALLLQQEFSAIGIKLKLQQDDQATETANQTTGSYQLTFPYAEFTSDVFVPDEYAEFVGLYNTPLHAFFTWWDDQQVQSEILHFVHNPNQAQRAQEWPKIQAQMLEQAPVINVMDLPFINAHQSNVCGTYLDALGADSLQYTWIAK